MSKHYNSSHPTEQTGEPGKTRKNPWITVLKVFCWCVGCLIVLAGIAVWIISYYLSPERITRLIEEKSSEYLHAEIKIGHLDYKLFRTYPWFEFEIDSLTVISKSLDGITPEERNFLPSDPDFLASVVKLKGEVNVHGLFHEDIRMKGIEIERPEVNLVMVNDSVANFNIVPSLPQKTKIPKIDISEINVISPINLSYFSLQDSIQAKAEANSFYLTQNTDHVYNAGFEGLVDGNFRHYTLPVAIPVKFDTSLKLDLPSISIKLIDLSFSVAGLAFEAQGDININKEALDFKDAQFKAKIDDIFSLLTYLPTQILEQIPLPSGLEGILPLDLTVNLSEPFHLNKENLNNLTPETLPSITGNVRVNNANLTYRPPKEKAVEANDIYLDALYNFNPHNPEETFLSLKELRMHGEGISIDGNAFFDNLLEKEQNFRGEFYFSSPLMKSLSYLMPEGTAKIAGFLKGKMEFSGKALNYGKEGLQDLAVTGDVVSHSLNVRSSSVGNLHLKNLKSDYQAKIPSYPLSNYAGTKLVFDLSADSLVSQSSGMKVILSALDMKLDAMDTVSGTPDPNGDIKLNIGRLLVDDGATSFDARNLLLNASGSLNSGSSNNGSSAPAANAPTGDDALIQSKIQHTPLELVYNGGGILQTLMNLVTIDAQLSIDKGNFKSPSYLYPVDFSKLNVSSNLNKVQFYANRVELSNTSFSIAGIFNGLKPFMTSYSATPLTVSADIDFTNVDINRLSWGYYGALLAQGEKRDSVFFVPPMTPFTAADSVCVTIPRNITANIRLRSQAAEYMDYRFSPLSTDIIVKDGEATLSQLTVGAPYCTAIVDWTYSTSHLDNIFMNLDAKVKNFSFSPFYGIFPQLVRKTPELKNFTGTINADIACHFQMFPNMFMNAESLSSEFDIKGSDMEFARQGKIEKITHLMLIQGDEPIHIENIDITGGYHDNLLQLNPFIIRFDGYQLEVGGVNNTAGDMYYHLALEKSPFHLPFGVSLTGKFNHPEIRLGGTHINDYKAELVSINPDAKLNINIMAYLKHGWLLFVQEAAKFEEKAMKDEQ